MVSKVDDTTPEGVIQLTLKLDDYNPKRDNPDLLICDYYDNSGDIAVEQPQAPESPVISVISYLAINDDGELDAATAPSSLSVGETYYWSADFQSPQWRVELQGDYEDSERQALEKLMVLRRVDDTTISLRPGKSNRIKGLQFKLIVCDTNGDHESSVTLEVAS